MLNQNVIWGKILISYLRLYFANIVRTSTSGLDSKIVWFYASVKINPIKLELKIDKRKSLVQQGCQEGLGHFLSRWPFKTGQSPCRVVHVCAYSSAGGRALAHPSSGAAERTPRKVLDLLFEKSFTSRLKDGSPPFPPSSFFLSLGCSFQSCFLKPFSSG